MFSKSISATRATQSGEADNKINGLPHLPSPQTPTHPHPAPRRPPARKKKIKKSVCLSPLSDLISHKEEHGKGRALQFEVHKKERNDWKKGTLDFCRRVKKNLAALKSTKRDMLRMGRFIMCAIFVGPDYSHNGPIMKISLEAVAFCRDLMQDCCTAAVY